MNLLKHVFFVVNANSKIGFGHLKRCLLLAAEFDKKHIKSSFISFSNSEQANKVVRGLNYSNFLIDKSEYNPETYIKLISKKKESLIIFDSDDSEFYTKIFQKSILHSGLKFMYITIKNDLHFYSHFVLNQNIMALSQVYKGESFTNFFLGPKYFILDDEFQKQKISQEGKVDYPLNILISFGSADPKRLTEKVLELLVNYMHLVKNLFIVIGGLNKRVEKIRINKLVYLYPDKCKIIVDTKNMYDIMSHTDLAITSGGLTFWELSVLKIPTLIFSGSEREKEIVHFLKEKQYCFFIGDFDDKNWYEKWRERLNIYFHLQSKRPKLNVEKLYNNINVNGKNKLVNRIIKGYEKINF